MAETDLSRAILHTERTLPYSAAAIFAAIGNPERLARWWGPDGFTNTFEEFDFREGGRWVFTMHGPDGKDYANENVFREIVPDAKVVLEHVVPPHFRLTITLSPSGEQTHLTWDQEFESIELADRLRSICEPANEQNLDRLEQVMEQGNKDSRQP